MFEIDKSVFFCGPRCVYATESVSVGPSFEGGKIHVCVSGTIGYLLNCDAVAMELSRQGDCWVLGPLLRPAAALEESRLF